MITIEKLILGRGGEGANLAIPARGALCYNHLTVVWYIEPKTVSRLRPTFKGKIEVDLFIPPPKVDRWFSEIFFAQWREKQILVDSGGRWWILCRSKGRIPHATAMLKRPWPLTAQFRHVSVWVIILAVIGYLSIYHRYHIAYLDNLKE